MAQKIPWLSVLLGLLLVSTCSSILSCSPIKGLLSRGDSQASAGKYPEAFAAYAEADTHEKETAQGLYRSGLLLLHLQEPLKAIPFFTQALKKVPNWKDARMGMARAYLAKGDDDMAQEYAEQLTKQDPNAAGPYFICGMVQKRKGKLDEALVLFENAIRHNMKYFDAHMERGNVLFLKKELEKAMQAYQFAVASEPKNPDGLIGIGRVFLEMGKTDKAVNTLEQAAALGRRKAEAHLLLGEAFFRAKQMDKALQSFQTALRINPKLGLAHTRLGQLYEANLMPERALEEYLLAVELDAKCVEAHLNLARVHLDKKDFPKAKQHLKKAVEANPSCLPCVKQLATLQYRDGQNQEVVAALEKLLQADYQDKEAHFLLGQAYVQLGLLEKATGEFNALSMVNDLERANALLEQIQRKEKSAPAESPDSQSATDKKKGGRKTPRAKRH